MAKAKKQPATPAVEEPTTTLEYAQLYFWDEVPSWSFGLCHVLALYRSDGRHVQLMRSSDCDEITVSREVYASLVRSRQSQPPIELDEARRADLSARLLRNAKIYDRHSALLREVLVILGVAEDALPPALRHQVRVSSIIDPTVVGDGGPETPMHGEGSGKLIQRLWMTGRYTPEDLVAIVLANWPGRKTKVSDVFYNYNLLKKAGLEGVPPWPSKKG